MVREGNTPIGLSGAKKGNLSGERVILSLSYIITDRKPPQRPPNPEEGLRQRLEEVVGLYANAAL
jgi:hypothetical protein